MKKIFAILFSLVISQFAFSQGKVSTRSYRLADFPDKITKVVLVGNEVLCSSLRQEVVNHWDASAFEFCTEEQFHKLMSSPDYYFLIPLQKRFKEEQQPGVVFLSLLKGGPEAKAGGIGAMHEIVSLPLAAASVGGGRELVFMSAFVRSIQSYTLAAMGSEKVAYLPENWFNDKYAKEKKTKQIFFSKDDLEERVDEAAMIKYSDEDIHYVEESLANEEFSAGGYNTLVSYCVSPLFPENGSFSYQLLINADTLEIYYISKHKISEKSGPGFTLDDLKKISKGR